MDESCFLFLENLVKWKNLTVAGAREQIFLNTFPHILFSVTDRNGLFVFHLLLPKDETTLESC
jgi:hypothetical protein